MDLSLKEAATVLGKSERQVRYLIKMERLKATKEGGQWRIESIDLPISDRQREALGERLEAARDAVQETLKPAARTARGGKKKRQYSVRDRVVHHALHRILAPRLDPGLIETTYACLPGRGSHRAVLRFLRALRRYRFVLLLDIRHYFLSIDRRILSELMARQIKDRPLLTLLARVAESGSGIYRQPGVTAFLGLPAGFPPPGCGLPIGNLTSQWWGNHYLSGVDHFIKRELKIPHYQRYMDDLALFGDSAAELEEARERIGQWLLFQRNLRLKKPNAAVRRTTRGFTYLGYRVGRSGIRPSSAFLGRMQARLMELVLSGDVDKLERSLASYRGLLTFPVSG